MVNTNEIDFFNNGSVEPVSSSNESSNIDFFADMTGSSVNNQTPIVSNTEPAGDFSTMRYMFATNAPNTAGNNLNQFGFNTSVNQKQPSSGLDFDWSAASSQPKQP